jgi:hypothetical protein
VAYGPRRRGRLATGGCIFGSPYASWLRGHGAFVFPGEGAGHRHFSRSPVGLVAACHGGRDMASSSGGLVGLSWGTFPGGQGPGLLHEGSIEQAPSASMAVEEPPPPRDGGKIW